MEQRIRWLFEVEDCKPVSRDQVKGGQEMSVRKVGGKGE